MLFIWIYGREIHQSTKDTNCQKSRLCYKMGFAQQGSSGSVVSVYAWLTQEERRLAAKHPKGLRLWLRNLGYPRQGRNSVEQSVWHSPQLMGGPDDERISV